MDPGLQHIEFKESKFEGCTLPNHPMYAEELSREEFGDIVDDPIVKAAYDIACEVHAKPRNEKQGVDKPFAYITHPIMVCKFLQMIKQALPEKYAHRQNLTSEGFLSVALLHDVLEEKGATYFQAPKKLEQALLDRVIWHVVRQELAAAKSWAPECVKEAAIREGMQNYSANKKANLQRAIAAIVKDCSALCNPEEMEDKREYQVDHMYELTPQQKLIKMLDQMASVTEDLLFESKRPPQKIAEFIFKALDVVKAGGSSGSDEHKMAEELFLQLFQKFYDMRGVYLGEQNNREALLQQFTYNRENLIFCPESGQPLSPLILKVLQARNAHLKEKSEGYEAHLRSLTQEASAPELVAVNHAAFSPAKPARSQNEAEYRGNLTLPDYGVVNVKIVMHQGKPCVAGYSMRIADYLAYLPSDASHGTIRRLARKSATYLTGVLELTREGRQLHVGRARSHEGDMVRDYWLAEPVPVQAFIDATRDASDWLKRDIEQVLQEAASNPEKSLFIDQAAPFHEAQEKGNPVLSAAMFYELRKAAQKLELEQVLGAVR